MDFPLVILGITTGIFSMWGAHRMLKNVTPSRIQKWLRKGSPTAAGVNPKRAEVALTTRFNRSYLVPLSPVIGTLALHLVYLIVALVAEGTAPLELLVFFVVGLAGSYPFLLHAELADYRQKFASMAARQLVRKGNPEAAGKILEAASDHTDPKVRLAAVHGLRELGTKTGLELLEKLSNDADHPVAAAARDALSDLIPVLKGTAMLSVRTMDTYTQEHKFLEGNKGSNRPDKVHESFDKLYEITRQIDEIVFSQLPIRRAYPDVFCMDCYSRAEDLQYQDWQWVRCKRCKEVHGLKTGVVRVVGQIGGERDQVLEQGLLYLNLWDEGSRKAKFAELDVLEVIAGKPLSYDWAVSALIDRLHNQGLGENLRVAVKLVGNPELEVNSLHLLRTLDPGMMGG